MKYSLALFDFDGTIIDSAQGIIDSVLYALHKFGIQETDRERLRAFIGPPLFESFRDFYGVSDDVATGLVSAYREFYGPEGHKRCHVYDGIPELLRELRNAGVITAVASAKPEDFVKKIVVEQGISEGFDIVKGNTFTNTDPDKTGILLDAIAMAGDIPKDEIVMIGDRHFDIDAGKALGVHTIGVAYGFGSLEELKACDSEFIAEDVSELRNLLL